MALIYRTVTAIERSDGNTNRIARIEYCYGNLRAGVYDLLVLRTRSLNSESCPGSNNTYFIFICRVRIYTRRMTGDGLIGSIKKQCFSAISVRD